MAVNLDKIINQLNFFCTHDSKGLILSWESQLQLSNDFSISLRDVEQIALENDIIPARYQRNRNTISITQQRNLFHKKVAVVGCGGLGGYIVEEIARLGIGSIILIDSDEFEEHNINRQILSTMQTIGAAKSDVAKKRVITINPTCLLETHMHAITNSNGEELLAGSDLVFDALDSINTRLSLVEICKKINAPLVHGAIAGWYGQVTTQLPDDDTLQKWYSNAKVDKGVEDTLGNLAFVAATVASLQVAEACKVLLQGNFLRKKMMTVNLLDMEFELIDV